MYYTTQSVPCPYKSGLSELERLNQELRSQIREQDCLIDQMNHKFSSVSRDYGLALSKIKQLEALVKDVDNQALRNGQLEDRLAQSHLDHQRN